MSKNESLHRAKDAKKDEFYTQYEDIQKELNHYEKHFNGKTVFCNCDDPFESNFCKFFLLNFNRLGLKRLICTSYTPSPVAWRNVSLFDGNDEPVVPGHGYVMDICEVPMKNGGGVAEDDIDALLKSKKRGVKKLTGDGDFRSEECVEYLKQADIVVTNPPFSLFREYVAQLMEYGKQFLIIGNQNAITYKEIFPLIKDNKIWLGNHSGHTLFAVPEDYTIPDFYDPKDSKRLSSNGYRMINGRLWRNLGNICWFTNLDHGKRHEKLILYKKYHGNEEEYPKYDNYDAINVDKVSDIPCDYFPTDGSAEMISGAYDGNAGLTEINVAVDNALSSAQLSSAQLSSNLRHNRNGVMGVPITFLDKYNPDQFEIIGATESEGKGFSDGLWDAGSGIAQPVVNGARRYKRLFIKRRMQRCHGGTDHVLG